MEYKMKKKIRNTLLRSEIGKKIYLMANTIKLKKMANLDNESFAKRKYKENTGKNLNIENPSYYNEKLWWLKIYNRDPLMTICSDKDLVREYVKNLGLGHLLIDIIGIYNSTDTINFENINEKVILKCTHGSGTNMLYKDKKSFDYKKFKSVFNNSLKKNYYYQSREWNYKNIEPKIIVEKVIESKNKKPLLDYRFLCFDGVVKLVLIDKDTMAKDGSHASKATRNIFDTNFELVNMKIGRENFSDTIEKPVNFEKMIKYAEKLAEPFAHCRVDLYNVDGKIYFGEITFYSGGGTQNITPIEWDKKLGTWIDLESKKIVLE